MLNLKRTVVSATVAGLTAMAASPAALAANGEIFGFKWAFSGILRADVAVSTTSQPNPNNQFGNPYNELTVERTAGNPDVNPIVRSVVGPAVFDALSGILGDDDLAGLGLEARPEPFSLDLPGFTDTIRRGCAPNQSVADCPGLQTKQNTFNYHVLRSDLDFDLNLTSNLRFVMRLRALYNVADFEDTFERDKHLDNQLGAGAPGTQGGVFQGGNQTYTGRPSQFEYHTVDDNNPLLFEWAGRDYFVDLPAFLLEYNTGSLTMRLGNQQIAWGQTIFFRILDKVNGLDLRRHLVLDRALEEFSDERVPAPTLRTTYQITNDVLVDTYVQQFRPRIFPNTNTPYNVIPAQFTVEDEYTKGDYDTEVNYGVRFKGDYGTFGWQAIYVRRYNPAGYFSWTPTNVDIDPPNLYPDGSVNVLGTALNQVCSTTGLDPIDNSGCGFQIARSPVAVSPSGQSVASADEFVYYGTQVFLDALTGLENLINNFSGGRNLPTHGDITTDGSGAYTGGPDDNTPERGDPLTQEQAHNNLLRQLDAFLIATGGLRGHIDRQYARENVYGLGGSYVTTADSGSFFNQIIVNLEAAYTPDKTFTDIGLDEGGLIDDELEVALVMEKYHRFTNSFPATYMVFQALHRSASDIFDRNLEGYGRDDRRTGTLPGQTDLSDAPSSANYIALAALQPWPQFIHEFSVAMLVDLGGGVLIQPGYRWKPRGNLTFELFYNYINGHAWGDTNTDNALSTVDFADEATVRLSYQF